jgi:hypothetical protein
MADPVDVALIGAGERWRATQPEPRSIDPSVFTVTPPGRLAVRAHAWSFLAGAAAALIVAGALAMALPGGFRMGGAAAPAATDPSSGYLPAGLGNCPITRPDGSFSPPAQTGVHWEDIEPGEAWYGSAELWTMLHREGEVWRGLPRSELGLGQKTFWWRQGYDVRSEPIPEIYVTGKRLDGPGRFTFGPGTNAFWGLGSAMLVGVDVPEGGCWELTARYRGKNLSYVVWVQDVGG